MSDYLPSFIVEPVLRQARRLSRLSGEESPGILSTVPDFQRWNPTRFWNTSPPPSLEEEETESTVQSIARSIQLWANQINNLDLDDIPSPPLEPMDDVRHNSARITQRDEPSTSEFPALEPQVVPAPRPSQLGEHRSTSETSLNPAQELPYRSRVLENVTRGHSQSDPLAGILSGQSNDAPRDASLRTGEYRSDGYVRRRDGSGALPEDDGMGHLRQRISAVWAGPGTAAEKSRLVHLLMMERYRGAQKPVPLAGVGSRSQFSTERTNSPLSILSASSQEVVFSLSQKDLQPTYAPLEVDELVNDNPVPHQEATKPVLGCIHYVRNVKMQCSTCERWYTCRFCHDEVENHTLPRRETKHMLCMLCNIPQNVAQTCKMCGKQAACYYCAICKLWNNDPRKSIYHCDDCGICRLGEGLGKDFFHCKTCAACMSIQAESTHKCIERSTKCDCPICGEYMFTSNKPVAFMRCGHSIHEKCFAEWCNTSYKCPICSKSIANMESQFRRLDRHIEEQPMPEEYRDNRAYIFCNDCNSRSVTRYHWLGLKCALCESYNTTQLELLAAEQADQLQEQQERVQEAGVGEAGITASQSHTPTGDMTSPAVSVPSSTRGIDIARSPAASSPWMMPHSPSNRSIRSASPAVGSYFGTGTRTSVSRRGTTPLEDDDNLDFWGGQSPVGQHATDENGSSSESESSGEEMEEDEQEEDEEEDAMDLFGHR